ncbi:MAG: hypothetical protein JWQ21_3436 [Herminiimonas sp.]|nr:hypothetical protein [Herminiimonas sp.]
MNISRFHHGASPEFDADSLLGLVTQSVGLAIMVWELFEDKVYLSEQWSVLLEGPVQNTVTTPAELKSLIHRDDRFGLNMAIVRCLKGGEKFCNIEFRVLQASGNWKWLAARGRIVQRDDASGRVHRVVATLVEANERKRTEKILEENEDRYRSIFNHSLDGILLATPDGKILSANPAICRISGYGEEELKTIGRQGLMDMTDPRVAELIRQRADTGLSSGEAGLIRKDGRRIEVGISSAVFTDRAGLRKTALVFRDMTERKAAELSLFKLSNLYSARSRCNQAIIHGESRDALLTEVCRIAVECGNFSLAWIGIEDRQTRLVETVARHGLAGTFLDDVCISTDPDMPEGQGPLGRAIRENRHYVCNDFFAEPGTQPWRDAAFRHGFKSMAVFPIVQDERVIGALTLYAPEKDYFDSQLVALLAEIARDIAFGLENLQRKAALLASEARFRTLWETTPDAIVMLDAQSIIRYANPAVLDLFGHRPEAVIGKDLAILQPERLRQAHRNGMQRYLATGVRGVNWRSAIASGLHCDGHEFPIELAFNDVQFSDERQFVACIRDISERKQAEDLVASQNRILKMMTAGAELEETLAAINRLIEDASEDALCSVLVLNDEGTQFAWGAGTSLPEICRHEILAESIGPDAGFCGTAAHRKEPVIVSDIAADSRWPQYRESALSHGLQACFSWPILGRLGQVLGAFVIYHRRPGPPTGLELRLVQLVIDLAGLAIESRKSEERIRHLAHYDELTGLPNRVMFSQVLSHALAQASRDSHRVGILFMDLDRFKNINDTLGHEAGDRVLQEAARRLRHAVREVDTVARLGGDEFVVLVENFKEPSALISVAKKLIDQLAAPMTIERRDFHQTVSIGISTYPDDGEDIQTLIKHADIAMYRAKEGGRNNHRFYSAQMSAGSLERMVLESDLRHAIEHDEFVLHYQPKLNIATGEITGIEALLRWRHPEKGLLSPFKFISLAEETGQIVPIGQWVLQSACRQARAWQRMGLPPTRIAVNLSTRQFAHGDLLSDITAALQRSGLVPGMLELEITESMVMNNAGHAIRLLNELKAIGVHISMDDFGTGFSSLANLKRFPLNCVKVDRSFIRDIPQDSNDAAITHAVIAMAHALNLKVVAEGVETADQLAFLREHGCDEIQGYYFSRPLSAEAIETFMRQHTPSRQGIRESSSR